MRVQKSEKDGNLKGMDTETYKCSKCKRELPRNAFHEAALKDRHTRPVYSSCRDCRKISRNQQTGLCGRCDKIKRIDSIQGDWLCGPCAAELHKMKRCRKCGIAQFLDQFRKNGYTCRGCVKPRKSEAPRCSEPTSESGIQPDPSVSPPTSSAP